MERIHPAEVYEGDKVAMHVSAYGAGVPDMIVGTVTEAPRESTRKMMRDGTRVMTDFVVEMDDGRTFRYMNDNGYVSGFHESLDRRSDVARFRKFTAVPEMMCVDHGIAENYGLDECPYCDGRLEM